MGDTGADPGRRCRVETRLRLLLRIVLLVGAAGTLAACASAARWDDAPKRASGWSQPTTHTVRHGDTLYAIAFRYQLDYKDLARWNGIGSGYLIHAGDVLRLTAPPQRSKPSGRSKPPQTASTPSPRQSTKPPPSKPPAQASTPSTRSPYRWRWPTNGKIDRGFSTRSKGIEIGGTAGQNIVAAAAGEVVYSGGALKGYGQLLIIKHGGGWLSAYGHNRTLRVREGQSVSAGQHIADMGIGPSSRAVLHFEIRRNGKPVNPEQYLPAR